MVSQKLARPAGSDPARVVAHFGAVQAQEYAHAKWGLALRMSPRVSDARIEQAVNRGRILRTHVLRPTWHFVTPKDIRWMLELTAGRIRQRMSPYDRQLGLDSRTFIRATRVFERALRDGSQLTRTELSERLKRGGLPSDGMRVAHLALYAEAEGVICSGPRRGKQITYMLLDERVPPAVRRSGDDALAELARRYFRSHGPATVRDFVWWSGLKTADAVRAVEMIGARAVDLGGRRYWSVGRVVPRSPRRPVGRLLPIYDEYLVAYRDREAVPHPAFSFSGTGGYATYQHAAILDGQVVGVWKPVREGKALTVKILPRRRLSPAERQSLEQSAVRYGRFTGVPARTQILRS